MKHLWERFKNRRWLKGWRFATTLLGLSQIAWFVFLAKTPVGSFVAGIVVGACAAELVWRTLLDKRTELCEQATELIELGDKVISAFQAREEAVLKAAFELGKKPGTKSVN